MPHRYDDDPMTFVPYRPATVTLLFGWFLALCLCAALGIVFILLVLLVA